METRNVLLFVAAVSVESALAQAPLVEWEATFGGSGFERAYTVQPVADGGYLVAGVTESEDGDVTGQQGALDFWLVKTDANGGLVWEQTLGVGLESWVQDAVELPSGDLVLVGWVEPIAMQIRVVKMTSNGTIVWVHDLGGSYDERGYAIDPTPDGGFLIAGQTHSNDVDVSGNHGADDAWVVKLDQNGIIQWQRCLGGSGNEVGYDISSTPDGGSVVLCGTVYSDDGDVTGSHGMDDVWVVKLDAVGAIEWQQCYGGSNSEWGYELRLCPDGGYVFVGGSRSSDGDLTSNQGDADLWAVKLDTAGVLVWQMSFGGSGYDEATSLSLGSGLGYTVAGQSWSSDGDVSDPHPGGEAWLLHLGGTGTLVWEHCYGGSSTESAQCIRPTSDGGFVLAGGARSADGDVGFNQGLDDFWLVKLSGSEGTAVPTVEDQGIQAVCDPSGQVIRIELGHRGTEATVRVCDMMGKVLAATSFRGHSGRIDLQALTAGGYVVEVSSPVERSAFRFVVY
ncbi:MAG: T9SS type A sorting domain-containing protein [Flavobacteriales bacterium]